MPAVSSVVMPEFERRSTDAARVRVVVLGALARQRLTAPLSLGAGLLAWPARRSRWRRPWLAAEPLTSSFWPPSPLDGSPPKGLSDDGGFEEFVEFLASRSASSTVIACNRHRSSRRAPELSPSKKARFPAPRGVAHVLVAGRAIRA